MKTQALSLEEVRGALQTGQVIFCQFRLREEGRVVLGSVQVLGEKESKSPAAFDIRIEEPAWWHGVHAVMPWDPERFFP